MKTSSKDTPKYQTRLTSQNCLKEEKSADVENTALNDGLPDFKLGKNISGTIKPKQNTLKLNKNI